MQFLVCIFLSFVCFQLLLWKLSHSVWTLHTINILYSDRIACKHPLFYSSHFLDLSEKCSFYSSYSLHLALQSLKIVHFFAIWFLSNSLKKSFQFSHKPHFIFSCFWTWNHEKRTASWWLVLIGLTFEIHQSLSKNLSSVALLSEILC